MKLSVAAFAGIIATASSQVDIPTNSGDCNALCDVTPDCGSALFDTVSDHCYIFDCVITDANSRIPWQFVVYEKPGASSGCGSSYEVPEPGSPPPPEPTPTTKPCPPSSTNKSPDNMPATTTSTLETVIVRPPASTTTKGGGETTPETTTDGPAPASPTSDDDDREDEGSQDSTPPDNADEDDTDGVPAAPNTDGASVVGRPALSLLLGLASLALGNAIL